MRKRLIKLSAIFMGVFSIMSLIQKNTLKYPKRTTTGNTVVSSGDIRNGGDDSGFILFDSGSNSVLS